MSLRNLRQVFEDGDGRLSFGRLASGTSVAIWAALLGFAGLRDGARAAVDAFTTTAPQLAILIGSIYGVSRGSDALEGMKGTTPRPPKEDL